MGHVTTDLVLRNEINVAMESIYRGNFITKYKYKDRCTFISFSFGNKMSWAMCKSLSGILFPNENEKNVLQS